MSRRRPHRRTGGAELGDQPTPGTNFWAGDEATLLTDLGTRPEGLTSAEAESRQAESEPASPGPTFLRRSRSGCAGSGTC